MQRLQTHLDHFRRLDDLAQADSFIHRLHPAVKIITTLIFLITVSSYAKYEVAGLLPMLLYPVAMISLGRLPLDYFAERLVFLFPFVILMAIANPFFGTVPFWQIGGIAISGGWVSFVSILFRFALAVTAVLALVATTGIHDIGTVLMRAGLPKILVLQLFLLYRYLSLLLEEGYRIEQAYVLRSNGNGRGIAPRAWGSLAGGLLLRTFTRAQKVYESMLCRGFTGELRYLRMVRLSAGSLVYLAGWVIFFIGVRFNNIPVKLGDWVRGAFG